jgi:DNA-binding NtrC family response regulator
VALKLLILEDDESLLNSLKGIYELLDYEVFATRRGDEALTIIEKENPHVVLCDLHLENSPITGIEVLKQTNQKYPDIKVIVATGYGKDDGIVKVCSQYKPFMFMGKPIDFDKLSGVLQELSDNIK